MLLAAGREVVSKTSAYNITKLTYRVEVCVDSKGHFHRVILIEAHNSLFNICETRLNCLKLYLMNILLCLSIILQTRDVVEWVYSIKIPFQL